MRAPPLRSQAFHLDADRGLDRIELPRRARSRQRLAVERTCPCSRRRRCCRRRRGGGSRGAMSERTCFAVAGRPARASASARGCRAADPASAPGGASRPRRNQHGGSVGAAGGIRDTDRPTRPRRDRGRVGSGRPPPRSIPSSARPWPSGARRRRERRSSRRSRWSRARRRAGWAGPGRPGSARTTADRCLRCARARCRCRWTGGQLARELDDFVGRAPAARLVLEAGRQADRAFLQRPAATARASRACSCALTGRFTSSFITWRRTVPCPTSSIAFGPMPLLLQQRALFADRPRRAAVLVDDHGGDALRDQVRRRPAGADSDRATRRPGSSHRRHASGCR